MDSYQPELWRDLYVMLGTSSAALLGLLYVVTSLHLDEIFSHPAYRTRARSNSVFLIITLVEAALVLTPQPLTALGIELLTLNLFGWWFPISNTYQFLYKNRDLNKHGGLSPFRAVAFHAAFIIGAAGGTCLASGLGWGMYLTTTSFVGLLVVTAMNGWSIMLGIGRDETRANARKQKKAR
jgi:energy-converting hydrogenase Eha subunit A